MKVSTTILTGCLTIGSIGLFASSALACHGGFKYGGYSSHYYPKYVERVYVQERPVVTSLPFAPAHSIVVVMPGDSWPTICAREYGNPALWGQVAAFNGIPQNIQLTPGMQLRLPVINPNGSFGLSSAPAMAMPPQGFAGGIPQGLPQGFTQGMPQGGFQSAPQGWPQGMQPGLPQGVQAGPQVGLPQSNGSVQQVQGFVPQQGPMDMPQGAPMNPQGQPIGQQMQQLPPQAPNVPQASETVSTNNDSVAQRIADQLTGLPGLMSGQPATANPNAGPTDRPLPSIVIGSIMTINGQPLGEGRGTVRLIVNGSPVPLEIVEWTASNAKVRIPADLPAGIQVQIEILRADGSVVAKDNVRLAAGQNVATANR